jgi:hypothetical protein
VQTGSKDPNQQKRNIVVFSLSPPLSFTFSWKGLSLGSVIYFAWAPNSQKYYNLNEQKKIQRGEDPQQFVSIQILQSAPDLETAKILEKEWTLKLFSFVPTGLNLRDEFADLW